MSKVAHALELEKWNVQLEEQKFEHVLKTAEINLDSVEKKEVETRKRTNTSGCGRLQRKLTMMQLIQ